MSPSSAWQTDAGPLQATSLKRSVRSRPRPWLAPYCHTPMEEPESNTRCVHCGYEWTYSGYGDVKPVATCPSCGNKTPTENIEEEEANA